MISATRSGLDGGVEPSGARGGGVEASTAAASPAVLLPGALKADCEAEGQQGAERELEPAGSP